MKIAISLLIFLSVSSIPEVSSLPEVTFKANLKQSTKKLNDNSTNIPNVKTTITMEHESFKFGRKRINKKGTIGYFYCHNAHKGCITKAAASINGNITLPQSYTLISIEENHKCYDTNADRLAEEAIRQMKKKINENPASIGVYDTWQTVQNEMSKNMTEASKAAFFEKLGKFEDISKSLYNIKRSSLPPAPKDTLEFDTNIPFFNYNDNPDDDGYYEKFVLADEYHRNTGRVVLFGTTESMQNLAQSRGILVDGTFKVAPKLWAQLFVIHGEIESGVYVPVAYAYLPNKKKETYDVMWKMLKESLEILNLNLAAEYVNSDYELNIRTTWEDNFNIPTRGCAFHYSQCQMKQINKAGMQEEYSKNEEFQSHMQAYVGLSYLPPDMVKTVGIRALKLDAAKLRGRAGIFANRF